MNTMMVAGNWKMHGSRDSVEQLLQGIKEFKVESVDMVVFPPFIFLSEAERVLKHSCVSWGAQNVSAENEGAFTGEISTNMLRNYGCQYVLLGHSERRHLYQESDLLVAEKFAKSLADQLIPILCVGETMTERNAEHTELVVLRQLDAIFNKVDVADFPQEFIIAYEPVWAIGTGLTATPEQAQGVHQIIRQHLHKQVPKLAESTKILYGGSVKVDNAPGLFSMPDINGVLVGGASLKAADFLAIAAAAKDNVIVTT